MGDHLWSPTCITKYRLRENLLLILQPAALHSALTALRLFLHRFPRADGGQSRQTPPAQAGPPPKTQPPAHEMHRWMGSIS